jgi:hypothetical protein
MDPRSLDTDDIKGMEAVRRLLSKEASSSVISFLESKPGSPFGQLYAYACGKYPIIANDGLAGFRKALFAIACEQHVERQVAIDMLVRSLKEHLGRGWNQGAAADARRAMAYAEWRVPTVDDEKIRAATAKTCEKIWESIKAIAPIGWKPNGTDDKIITAAFSANWPDGFVT